MNLLLNRFGYSLLCAKPDYWIEHYNIPFSMSVIYHNWQYDELVTLAKGVYEQRT